MSKGKDTTIKELRREVEALRAQLKLNQKKVYDTNTSTEPKVHKLSQNVETSNYDINLILDDKYVKKQLTKTLVLTIFSFAVILSVYIYGVGSIIQMLYI